MIIDGNVFLQINDYLATLYLQEMRQMYKRLYLRKPFVFLDYKTWNRPVLLYDKNHLLEKLFCCYKHLEKFNRLTKERYNLTIQEEPTEFRFLHFYFHMRLNSLNTSGNPTISEICRRRGQLPPVFGDQREYYMFTDFVEHFKDKLWKKEKKYK